MLCIRIGFVNKLMIVVQLSFALWSPTTFRLKRIDRIFKGMVILVSPLNAKLQLLSMHHVCKALSAVQKV